MFHRPTTQDLPLLFTHSILREVSPKHLNAPGSREPTGRFLFMPFCGNTAEAAGAPGLTVAR